MRLLTISFFASVISLLFVFQGCGGTRSAQKPNKPNTGVPGKKPVPVPSPVPPPIVPPDKKIDPVPANSGKKDTYKIAILLPFLTSQYDGVSREVPEKSRLALQYYGGIQLAFNTISQKTGYPNLVVDVLDAPATDAEFALVMKNPKLTKAQVILGPLRSSQVAALAQQTKTTNQILLSPETPNSDLTTQNPGFIQANPSLRAHCARIVQYVRAERKIPAEQVVLVCKQKEADRLPYFQDANRVLGGTLKELVVPDNSFNFDKIDLKKYIKSGQTNVFIMPSWAGQDWVLAFLSRLKTTKGSNTVEVYGMPQWIDYEQIEPDLLQSLNVHITSASFIDRNRADVKDFEQQFYEQFGTIPDEDAFNGYDAAMLTADMLRKFGLSFPEKMSLAPSLMPSLSGGFYLRRVKNTGTPVDSGGPAVYEYVENIFVHILKFDHFRYSPPED
jgi:hypothetical protein